jgi:Helicase HerA, central domain
LKRFGSGRFVTRRPKRRAKAAKQHDAVVDINVHDMIGHKTGMFGMTRMGKSNTMKIVVARTFMVSERLRAEGEPPIGQLIFDPQGEYANPNAQDGTQIAAIGDKHVVIYAFGGGDASKPTCVRWVSTSDPAQLDAVKGMIAAQLSDGGSDYVRAFVQADLKGDPVAGESSAEGYKRRARAERGRVMLYGALAKCASRRCRRPTSCRSRSTGTVSRSSTRHERLPATTHCRRQSRRRSPAMPYQSISGTYELASRLGHSTAAVRAIADKASFHVPAEQLRDVTRLASKVKPRSELGLPADAVALSAALAIDGSHVAERIRDGLPSICIRLTSCGSTKRSSRRAPTKPRSAV